MKNKGIGVAEILLLIAGILAVIAALISGRYIPAVIVGAVVGVAIWAVTRKK